MLAKVRLVTGNIYHIFNKSIAGFKIFNNDTEFTRMLDSIKFYQNRNSLKFSDFIRREEDYRAKLNDLLFSNREKFVDIIAYCLMPTHFHLILKQSRDSGISLFLNNTLNSYTRFFNSKHNRKGPLWEGRTKKILLETDEQLMHLTRYIHLNPVTSYLVDNPEDWQFSSYKEYITDNDHFVKVCKFVICLRLMHVRIEIM